MSRIGAKHDATETGREWIHGHLRDRFAAFGIDLEIATKRAGRLGGFNTSVFLGQAPAFVRNP
jgi:hypothetical protein